MALQASGNPISFSQIETEFGPNTDRKLGTYRVSQTVGGLTNQPLDTGIPQGTNPISFGNFYSKKLNVVIDYYSGEEETYAMPARDKYNLEVNQGTYTVIGGFRTRPVDSSGTKTRIHVNKRIGGMETLPETDAPLYCSLRTGTGWEAGTDLTVEVGSSGQLWGAGGRGGDGGKNNTVINGESGKGGSSALGIQYSGTTVINDGIISQGHGGGGGGGCNHSSGTLAPGGAGGGGAGYPHGLGGISDGPTTVTETSWSNEYWTTGSGGFNFTFAGSWSAASSAFTPVPSSDATFVVRDYNTGNFSLITNIFQANVNEVRYYANNALQYEYYLNGAWVGSKNLTSWQTGWKKYEVGDYVESTFDASGEILRYKIKYSERINNEHKFYINGTLVGSNTNGSVLTSGSNRYTMGDLVASMTHLDFNAYKLYKIKKEIKISDSGTNSSTSTSAGGQGFIGAFVDGGNGEDGTTTTGVYGGGGGGGGGNGVYDGVTGEGGEGGASGGGNATAGGDGSATVGGTGGTADSGEQTGTGGGGGTSGAAIRRTSGITVNITNNATINGPTDEAGVSV